MNKNLQQIGLGTAAIGRPLYINIRQNQTTEFDLDSFRQRGIDMLNAAYDQGIRYFDTAPGYGMAEQLLIDWVEGKNDPTIAHLQLELLLVFQTYYAFVDVVKQDRRKGWLFQCID